MTVYHDVLGVETTATKAEIKSAYREQLQRYHPDKSTHPDAEELFKDIDQAQEGLIEGERPRRGQLYYEWDDGKPVEPRSKESETNGQATESTGQTTGAGAETNNGQTSTETGGADRERRQQRQQEKQHRHQQQQQQTEPAKSKTTRTRRAIMYGGAAIGGMWLFSNLPDIIGGVNRQTGPDPDAEQLPAGGVIETPDGLEISVTSVTQSTRIYKSVSEVGGRSLVDFEDYTGYALESLGGLHHFIRIEVKNTTDEPRVVGDDLLDISTGNLTPQTEFIEEDSIIHANTPPRAITLNPGEKRTGLLIADLPSEKPETIYLNASFESSTDATAVQLPLDIADGEAEIVVESIAEPQGDPSSDDFEAEFEIWVSNTGGAPGTVKPGVYWSDGNVVNWYSWPSKQSTAIQPGETAKIPIDMRIKPVTELTISQLQYYIEGEEYDYYRYEPN